METTITIVLDVLLTMKWGPILRMVDSSSIIRAINEGTATTINLNLITIGDEIRETNRILRELLRYKKEAEQRRKAPSA